MQRERGFGLVELMVGLLISLVVSLAAYAVFKGTALGARRVVDMEATWHDAELALVSMGKSFQNAGYMMDLSAPGATAPIVAGSQNTALYAAPSGFPSQQITVNSNTNTTGDPAAPTPGQTVWDIEPGQTTGGPALWMTTDTTGNATKSEYADGIVALRFQFTCASDPSRYYTPACPGGASDARSVQVAMLSRGMAPDPANKVVAQTRYVFPDGSVYAVPTNGGVGCVNGDCTRYRHQLFVTEFPLRNLNWGL